MGGGRHAVWSRGRTGGKGCSDLDRMRNEALYRRESLPAANYISEVGMQGASRGRGPIPSCFRPKPRRTGITDGSGPPTRRKGHSLRKAGRTKDFSKRVASPSIRRSRLEVFLVLEGTRCGKDSVIVSSLPRRLIEGNQLAVGINEEVPALVREVGAVAIRLGQRGGSGPQGSIRVKMGLP